MPSPRYQRRHYNDTAKILRRAHADLYLHYDSDDTAVEARRMLNQIFNNFVSLYTDDNPNFSLEEFKKACGAGE